MLFLKWWNRLRLASVCLPALSLLALSPACQGQRSGPRSGIPDKPVEGSFKITLKNSEESEAVLQQKLAAHASDIATRIDCGTPTVEALAWAPGALSQKLSLRFHVQFSACKLDRTKLETALIGFQEDEAIESVEATAVVQLTDESDPLKAQSYHLAKVNRDAACSATDRSKAKEVIVAIIDSGVDGNHPDLSPNFLRAPDGSIVGANFVGKGARAAPDSNWGDTNGHGTHVAGLVGAVSNNGQGTVGAAACTPVKIMPIRVLNEEGQGSSLEIERGVQWAIANGADVINLSLGTLVQFREPKSEHRHPLYDEAAAQGVVIFAASGNEGLNLGVAGGRGYHYSYPASYENVISVAATGTNDQLARFSNRGGTVDIAAPGDRILSTLRGGNYGLQSGTSMASPLAAGVYALALAATRQSNQDRLKHDQLMPLLLEAKSRANLPPGDVRSAGVLDAKLLLDLMQKKWKGTPTQPFAPRQETAPLVNAPPPPPKGLHFVGLSSGMTVNRPLSFSVAGWTSNQTARIHLSWVPREAWSSFAFTTLSAAHLSADGSRVQTPDTYRLSGEGTLIALAVDSWGREIERVQIAIRGL